MCVCAPRVAIRHSVRLILSFFLRDISISMSCNQHQHVLQSASTGNQHLPGMAAGPRSPGLNPQSHGYTLALHTLHLPLSLARPSALSVKLLRT